MSAREKSLGRGERRKPLPQLVETLLELASIRRACVGRRGCGSVGSGFPIGELFQVGLDRLALLRSADAQELFDFRREVQRDAHGSLQPVVFSFFHDNSSRPPEHTPGGRLTPLTSSRAGKSPANTGCRPPP